MDIQKPEIEKIDISLTRNEFTALLMALEKLRAEDINHKHNIIEFHTNEGMGFRTTEEDLGNVYHQLIEYSKHYRLSDY